jgi:hypothetical protein
MLRMPRQSRVVHVSTRTGSRFSLRALCSQRSTVDTPKRTGSPVIGCCHSRAASRSSSARSSPFGGGAANSWPTTEKRI